MGWLFELTAAHWGVLGLLILIAEALGIGGFLLGTGASALLMAVLLVIFPDLSTATQLVTFAFSSVTATALYYTVLKDAKSKDVEELPETRTEGMIGQTFRLPEKLRANREKRIQIGDTFWRVKSRSAIDAGARVTIVDADPMRLELEESATK